MFMYYSNLDSPICSATMITCASCSEESNIKISASPTTFMFLTAALRLIISLYSIVVLPKHDISRHINKMRSTYIFYGWFSTYNCIHKKFCDILENKITIFYR